MSRICLDMRQLNDVLGAVPVVSLPKTSILKQVGKHTAGTLLMGIEDTTLGPSSLQAGQRPTKNLASDPAHVGSDRLQRKVRLRQKSK